MATFTSTACQTSASGVFLSPPKYIETGVIGRSALYTITTAASQGDIVQMIPIPRGAAIIDVAVLVLAPVSMTYTLAVGDGNSATRYIASATGGTQTIIRASSGVGYSYSAEDTIDVSWTVIGSASISSSVRLSVLYAMDQSQDGNS
jgi:hypothetical protein